MIRIGMYTDLMVPHLCSFAPQVCGNSPHMMLPQFRDAVGTTQLLGPVLVEFDLAHCFDVFSMAFLVNVGSNISQTNMELDSLKHLKQSQALRPCFSPSGQGECANLESKKPSRGRNWPWSSKNGLPLWLSSSVGRSAFPSSRVATTSRLRWSAWRPSNTRSCLERRRGANGTANGSLRCLIKTESWWRTSTDF